MKTEMDNAFAERVESIKMQAEGEYQNELEKTRRHFVELREKSNARIATLQTKIDLSERDKAIAINDAIRKKDSEISSLNVAVEKLKDQLAFAESNARNERESLRATLENQNKDKLMALADEKDRIINALRSDISVLSAENQFKEDQIASLKDFRSKLSTKLLGESLEKHCELSYDRNLRPAIPNATFLKDTSAGEKGDYIYRESDSGGMETLSILFEMKNEDDFSDSKKKKNRDFFEKLDKDRIRRNCSVAVLVSTLEPDNDMYNSGITCVTEYEKMYVIRPQSFVDFIHLMRSLADDKRTLFLELEAEKSKSVDIAAFESDLDIFKDSIAKNTVLARKHSNDIIKQIDRFIIALEKHKEKVLAWQKQAELAEKKAEKLSLKSLAKENPTVEALIDAEEGSLDANNEYITDVDETDIEILPNEAVDAA